jgi:large subunit ribosomal protein L10
MNRDEKAATIEEIAAQIEAAEAIFAVDYRGISVPQAAELRGKLREADASFRIVKNRLTKIAAEKVGEERLAELLQGPTALTFVRGDTAQAAKAISSFNKEHEVLTYRGGFMGEIVLDEDRFKSIAKLPSRDVLNGQFAGIVASPLTGLVRGLGSMIQGLALQLGQIAEKGFVSGESPAESKTAEAEEADEGEAAADPGQSTDEVAVEDTASDENAAGEDASAAHEPDQETSNEEEEE